MPSNYTGSPTATQAPGPQPIPGAIPIAALPADGDPENAASVSQAFKEAMDFIAWLMNPRAKASDWAAPIQTWKSAALHRRAIIDHLGFPAGRFNQWVESWRSGNSISCTTTGPFGGALVDDWNANIIKTVTGGNIAIAELLGPNNGGISGSRCLRLKVGDTVGDSTLVSGLPQALFYNDSAVVLEWEASVNAADALRKVAMGFNFGSDPLANSAIAQFHYDQVLFGNANIRCQTNDGSAFTTVDSGVALDASLHRFRVEYHGAGIDDAVTARCLFFIDGALVANITTTLPDHSVSPYAAPLFYVSRIATTTIGLPLYVGAVRFTANTWRDAAI